MPRKIYIQAIEELNKHFTEMLKEAQTIFINALQSLKDNKIIDDFKFKHVTKDFQKKEVQIEKEIFKLISLQAPVSSDLRLMLGILKSTNDVKRIVNTSQRITRVVKRYRDKDIGLFATKEDVVIIAMEEMGEILKLMMNQVIDVYLSDDKLNSTSAKALQEKLIEQDDNVDSLFKDTIKKLIKKIQKEADTKKQAKQIADGLILARHMERIGDHICNIAERIVYIDTGENLHIY